MSPKGDAQDSGRRGLAATTGAWLRRIPRRGRFGLSGALVMGGCAALAWEDASMLARRLRSAKPVEVPALEANAIDDLMARVKKTHAKVRGRRRERSCEGRSTPSSNPGGAAGRERARVVK